MKFKDLKVLSAEELAKKRTELELELLKARAQSARGTVSKNPHQILGIRKTLAQIKSAESQKSQTPAQYTKPTKISPKKRTTHGGITKS